MKHVIRCVAKVLPILSIQLQLCTVVLQLVCIGDGLILGEIAEVIVDLVVDHKKIREDINNARMAL